MGFLLRILYILWGKIIMLPVCYYCICNSMDKLPEFFYYFDNEEDGYNGDKRGWYSGYLDKDISTLSNIKRSWYAYRWSAWRNPCWNLRYHPYYPLP